MNLGKKQTHYLREAHIDFTSFDIVDIAPQPDDHAVVILAHKDPRIGHLRFNVQYRGKSLWYESLERLMDICVSMKLYRRTEANRVLKNFYETKEGGNGND